MPKPAQIESFIAQAPWHTLGIDIMGPLITMNFPNSLKHLRREIKQQKLQQN